MKFLCTSFRGWSVVAVSYHFHFLGESRYIEYQIEQAKYMIAGLSVVRLVTVLFLIQNFM